MRRIAAVALASIAVTAATVATTRTYRVDSARSRATIEVGKSGVFSAFGHGHQVAARQIDGTIALDAEAPERSTVRVTIDASRLEIVRTGESADDVPKIQQTMESEQVLDVKRYPTITFASTTIAIRRKTTTTIDATVTGDLTLHGQTRPVSVPVTAQIEGDSVSVTGRLTVKQTDYGIKPVTVAGVVSVKDALAIQFTIVGH